MSTIPLHRLSKGQAARISAIVPNQNFGVLDHSIGCRLADLGFCEGVTVTLIASGLWGTGPFAVRLENLSQFSLRKEETRKILCMQL